MCIISTVLYVISFLQYAVPIVLFTMLGLVSIEKVAVGYKLGRCCVVQLSPKVGSSKSLDRRDLILVHHRLVRGHVMVYGFMHGKFMLTGKMVYSWSLPTDVGMKGGF